MVSTVLNEGRRPAEFMISEGPGMRSRDVGHFANAGTVELDLPAGLVLGQLAAELQLRRLFEHRHAWAAGGGGRVVG